VKADIPRREHISSPKRRADFTADVVYQAPRPTFGSVLRRMAVWSGAVLSFSFSTFVDRILFRDSVRRRAVRLRKMLQGMGGTGVKIGQQLGLRADIIPIEYCDELMKLLDQVPPFPAEQAIAILEREMGKALPEIFESFDTEVIGSGSIGCVYQAYLPDGRKVAVKIRRPGIELEMRSDLKVINILGKLGETLTFIPTGSSRDIIREISWMLIDELDYRLEAMQTEAFGQQAERTEVVRTPAIIHELCNREVIVTEFMDGVFLHEILNALEDENPERLEALEEQGYDSVAISKNLVRMMFWQMYECNIFHADPHPANIVIQPDNSLTLIDFGVCGSLSKQSRNALQAIHRKYNDPHGMALAIIATQQPLPYIDVDRYAQELYYLVRDQTLAMRSKSGKWYEKSAGALWTRAAEISREYKVRLNPELLRYMRTSFLGDAILARLNPDLNAGHEFQICYKEFLRKQRKQRETGVNRDWGILLEEAIVRLGEFTELLGLELEQRRQAAERPHFRFALRVEKSSFAFSEILKTTAWSGFWLVVWAGTRTILAKPLGYAATPFGESMLWSLKNPGFLALLVLSFAITLRKITQRFDEPDVRGR
jgi:predicted unusual protein kinase regulating ubiquinone biosynthesis (AarF/ABC1/UbiB family)